jgi:Flp pilus assembly protein TadD
VSIYLLLLVPVLNIVPIRLAGPSYLAERFLYLPLLGIVFLLHTLRFEKRTLLIPAAVVLLAWITICNRTSSHWISDRTLFSWVREQAPQSALGFTNLGLEETRAGQPGLAAALSESALARDPSNADAWDNLGVSYYQMTRLAEAESCFMEALKLAPMHPLFSTNLAGTWRTMGRYDEALGLLAQVISSDRTAGSAYLNVGLCYMAMEQPKKAVQPLRRAAELMEVDPSTWMSLAKALLMTGDTSGGRTAVDRALKHGLAPQAAAAELATEGRNALYSGLAARAVAFLAAAVEVLPGDAGLLNDLGVGFRGLGRMDRAESCFMEATRFSEHLGMAWSNLGEIYALQGNEAVAESVLSLALTRWPGLPETYRHLGLLLRRRGEADTANVLLSRYLELAPNGIFAPEVRHILATSNRTPQR